MKVRIFKKIKRIVSKKLLESKASPKKFMIVDDSSPAVAKAKSPVRQTCKSMNFSQRKREAARLLTAIGAVITKTAGRKTIMNYLRVVKREKVSSTIMKNLNKLKLNDS